MSELAWEVFRLWAGGPDKQTEFCCLLEECLVVESSFIPGKKCAKCNWASEFFFFYTGRIYVQTLSDATL